MFGQFRVGVVQVAVEISQGELDPVLVVGEVHRCAKHLVPLMRVGRLRATQVHRQRGVIATQAIAAGAHVNRGEGIDGFVSGSGIARRDSQVEAVAVFRARQLQFQGVTDHLVIAHNAFEHFAQTAAGHQRITECMKSRGTDEARNPQAKRRVAADLYRKLP
ncbi:hypothetical protein D3C86_1154360 [compost metagenome]